MKTLFGIAGAVSLIAAAGSAFGALSTSTIGSNFNGTSIPSPRFVWFNSHLTSVSGASGAFTVYVRNQTVTFTSGGTDYTVNIPDAEVRFVPGSSASTTFGSPSGTWVTTVPSTSGTPFMSGTGWAVPPTGLPGGTNPVTWKADFGASVPGVSLSWQWSAAVYTQFSTDNSLVGATPVDGFGGFSQSGSPANYSSFVVGGARGGGGSNFTGSNSGTGSVNVPLIPAPATAGLLGLMAIGAARRRR